MEIKIGEVFDYDGRKLEVVAQMGCSGCFYGTGEKLIRKAYADSEDSGWHYEQAVRYAEAAERRRQE